MKLLAQGAEAVLHRDGDVVRKHRLVKTYRIPQLDATLRRSRQRREQTIIKRLAAAGVRVPTIIASDETSMTLSLEFIEGPQLRQVIDKEPERLGRAFGTILAQMHCAGVAHGDPTTSNFIVAKDGLYVIDFGLSVVTMKLEDFAVDLHLVCQVLTATHTTVAGIAWRSLLEGYTQEWADGAAVIERLEHKVEKRGRNKKR